MTTKITKLPGSANGDASLVRPKFSTGLLLQDDDLTQTVDYMRNMTRILFKSMLGCGVLCGLNVEAKVYCRDSFQINIYPGVALDCQGDLIELRNEEVIQYDRSCDEEPLDKKFPDGVWVVICHKERDCGPRGVLCSTQDGEMPPVYTRTREGFEIRVLKVETGDVLPTGCCGCESTTPSDSTQTCCDYIATGEDKCYESHYKGECACDCECDCIVLAKVDLSNEPDATTNKYEVDHTVRRFIRPVLMKDPFRQPAPASVFAARSVKSPAIAKQTKIKKEG